MKRLVYILIGFALLLAFVPACKEDEETALTSDCYISSFTLGALKRHVHYTDSTGHDTTYLISFSGSYYPLNIDQRAGTILLREPLPMETKINAVTATATFQGGLFYQPWDANSDSTWTAFSATDSIDFSAPLRFRVYATDGSSYRDYYLRLDVRTSDPEKYTWEKVESDRCPADDPRRLVAWGESLFLMTQDASSLTDPHTLVVYHDNLWVSSADGQQVWTKAHGDTDFMLYHTFEPATGLASLRLFAGSENALYGIGVTTDGQRGIYSSTDGSTWTAMTADADLSLFPEKPVALSYTQTNGNQRVLVVGQATDNETTCEVWSLLEKSGEPWTYFTPAPDNPYRLPALQDLCILSYNDMLMAAGGPSADGRYEALETCYLSYDNGITWKAYEELTVPAELKAQAGRISVTTLDDYIWFSVGTEIWRAHLNGYGENY